MRNLNSWKATGPSTSALGFIDPLGNFLVKMESLPHFVVPPDELGFFQKIARQHRVTMAKDALREAAIIVKEISYSC